MKSKFRDQEFRGKPDVTRWVYRELQRDGEGYRSIFTPAIGLLLAPPGVQTIQVRVLILICFNFDFFMNHKCVRNFSLNFQKL